MNMQQGSNCRQNNPPSKCSLMKSIYDIGFSLDDMMLYLDTHPRDISALNYYHKLQNEYNELISLYNKNYSPLHAKDVYSDKYYDWVNNPMPWEGDV